MVEGIQNVQQAPAARERHSIEAAPREAHKVDGGLLGDYELLEELGRGGMGTVYKARHRRLNRLVAVKVLARNCTADSAAVARFQREMEAVGKLAHPNLIQATDAREVAGTYLLATEFAEGLDLAKVVQRLGPLHVAEACAIIRQVALGLQHAHEHGLVHRDVKPSNVLLTPGGVVKLLDLGLARLQTVPAIPKAEAAVEPLTEAGQVLGTPDYMAPEQWGDSHSVDIRADLYSLGCTLYYLLTGAPPFAGPDFVTRLQKLKAHVERPVTPIGRLRPDAPFELQPILERLLAKVPGARFREPAELAAALEPFVSGAELTKLFKLAASDPAMASTRTYWSLTSAPRLIRPRSLAILVATAGLLVAVSLSALWASRANRSVASRQTDSRSASTATVQKLSLFVRRNRQDDRIMRFDLVRDGKEQSAGSIDALGPDDDFKLIAEFDRPTYWYLLWFDTEGRLTVVGHGQQPEQTASYPASERMMVGVNASDPKGYHLLLLVVGLLPPTEALVVLEKRLANLGPPPQVAPRQTSQLRGPGRETETSAVFAPEFLQTIESRLPGGVRARHALTLASR
jgi:serine/threonine protein kinase